MKEEVQNGSGFDLLDELGDLSKIGEVRIRTSYEPFKGISTGSLSLDRAIGSGKGVPRGQFIEIYGPEGGGKSTLALMMAVNAKTQGMKVAIASMEGRWNQQYAYDSGLGLPGKDYLLGEPETAEDMLNLMVKCAELGYDEFFVDSIAACSPRQEYEAEIGDNSYAMLARVLSQFFRQRKDSITLSQMAVIFLNQYRTKMNVTYGSPLTRPGGKALDYYCSVLLELQTPKWDEMEFNNTTDKEARRDPIGFTIRGKTTKNSICPNYREISIPVRFIDGLHLDYYGEVLNYGKQYAVFTNKDGGPLIHGGSNWYYKGEQVGKDRSEVRAWLKENDDLYQDIIRQIRELM